MAATTELTSKANNPGKISESLQNSVRKALQVAGRERRNVRNRAAIAFGITLNPKPLPQTCRL